MIEPKTCEADGCTNRAVARGLCRTHMSRERKGQDMQAPVRGWDHTQAYRWKRESYLAGIRDRVLAVVKEALEPMTAGDYAWVLGLPASWTGIEPLKVSPTSVGWILSRDPNMAITYTANKDNLYEWAEPVQGFVEYWDAEHTASLVDGHVVKRERHGYGQVPVVL